MLPAMLPHGEVGIDSDGDRGAELYGPFSPRVEDVSSSLFVMPSVQSTAEGEAIAAVVDPVLQIMPELRDLCASSALPLSLSMDHTKGDLSAALGSSERSDVISAPIPPSPGHNPDALFAKELCDLLSSVEAACPGSGRAIACLLTGTKIKGRSKKVKDCHRTGTRRGKRLTSKDKKNSAIEKVSAAA